LKEEEPKNSSFLTIFMRDPLKSFGLSTLRKLVCHGLLKRLQSSQCTKSYRKTDQEIGQQ